jgi:hypothetical protein
MIVWLWDSPGARGVSDDDGRARETAEAVMRASGAGTARVERARLALGYEWMTSGYLRSGYGWSAERHGDGIRWVPLAAPARSPVSLIR